MSKLESKKKDLKSIKSQDSQHSLSTDRSEDYNANTDLIIMDVPNIKAKPKRRYTTDVTYRIENLQNLRENKNKLKILNTPHRFSIVPLAEDSDSTLEVENGDAIIKTSQDKHEQSCNCSIVNT